MVIIHIHFLKTNSLLQRYFFKLNLKKNENCSAHILMKMQHCYLISAYSVSSRTDTPHYMN